MAYAEYIKDLLYPLGIYTFQKGSLSGSEVESIGAELDQCEKTLDAAEREALVPTAEDWGLTQLEGLFAKKPAAQTTAQRRAALAALLQIGGDDFTRGSINRALSGCGLKAQVEETAQRGHVKVTFPETAGVPEEFDRMAAIILDIIPLHLETEFYFRFLTWIELEAKFQSWQTIESGRHTWETLELAV